MNSIQKPVHVDTTSATTLSTQITGIVFWGSILFGLLMLLILLKDDERNIQALQISNTHELSRQLEQIFSDYPDILLPENQPSLINKIGQVSLSTEYIALEITDRIETLTIGDRTNSDTPVTNTIVLHQTGHPRLVYLTMYFPNIDQTLKAQRNKLIIFVGFFSFAFGLILNRVLQEMLTKPFLQMIKTADDYASGNTRDRFDTSKDNEFGRLAKFINQALDSSEQHQQELQQALTHSRNIEHELLHAKEGAEAANLAKSQFLSNMSHELRTPLNAIIGFTEILKMEEEFPLTKEQQEFVGHISIAGDHLLLLIDEVLDLAKIETGKLEISMADVSVVEAVEEIMEILNPQAHKRQVTLQNQVNDDNTIVIKADQTRFKQVLLNILSNAIKYNVENGEVTVEANLQENEKIRISITDTGIGIPEEKLSTVFEPFNRLGIDSNSTEGTGIGLTITKQMVELMDGTLGVSSILNKGSTFWVEFRAGNNLATHS